MPSSLDVINFEKYLQNQFYTCTQSLVIQRQMVWKFIFISTEKSGVRSTAAGYVRFSFVEDDFLNFLQYRGIFRFNARERKFTAKFTTCSVNLNQLKAAINIYISCAMQCLQFSSLFLSNTYVVKICHSLLNRKFLDHLKILLFKYLSTRPRQLR